MPTTALYAALLTVVFVFLSVRVIAERRRSGTALGDGANPALQRKIRVQGNFSEYVPLGLILLGIAEGLRAPHLLLHVLGLALLTGRLAHAFGVSRENEEYAFRATGMALTLTVLVVLAITCFLQAIIGT
jgi:uncharacterized membrane protein YecN with MAPEG domain